MALQAWKDLRRTAAEKLYRYPDVKIKTKDATNTDPWGPTEKQKMELAECALHPEDRVIVFKALWKRCSESREYWTQIVKALDVLEFFLLMDVPEVDKELATHEATLAGLLDYNGAKHDDERKKEQSNDRVRSKARHLLLLTTDPATLQSERERLARTHARLEAADNAGVGSANVNATLSAAASASSATAARSSGRASPATGGGGGTTSPARPKSPDLLLRDSPAASSSQRSPRGAGGGAQSGESPFSKSPQLDSAALHPPPARTPTQPLPQHQPLPPPPGHGTPRLVDLTHPEAEPHVFGISARNNTNNQQQQQQVIGAQGRQQSDFLDMGKPSHSQSAASNANDNNDSGMGGHQRGRSTSQSHMADFDPFSDPAPETTTQHRKSGGNIVDFFGGGGAPSSATTSHSGGTASPGGSSSVASPGRASFGSPATSQPQGSPQQQQQQQQRATNLQRQTSIEGKMLQSLEDFQTNGARAKSKEHVTLNDAMRQRTN